MFTDYLERGANYQGLAAPLNPSSLRESSNSSKGAGDGKGSQLRPPGALVSSLDSIRGTPIWGLLNPKYGASYGNQVKKPRL